MWGTQKKTIQKKDGNPEGEAPDSREENAIEVCGRLLTRGGQSGGEGDLAFILRDNGDFLFAL